MARRLSSIYGQTLKSSSDAPGISTSKNLVIGSDKIPHAVSSLDFPLQVSGGAYISGSVGIGTINPISKLHVVGDVRVTGIVTASSFSGNGSGLTGIISGIQVKEEGVGIGSTFTIINFIGSGVTATASGNTAVITFEQQVGPQGAQGFQGTAGAQGSVGDVGVQGAQGAVGAQGSVGAQGTAGTVGAQGTAGTVGAQGTAGSVGAQGAQGAGGLTTTDATTLNGISVHTGRNNEANKVVRTDGNGYIQAGWINSDSGDSGFVTRLTRITCSNDNYLRYLGLTDFKVSMGESAKNNYSRRVDYTSDANYHVGSFGHSSYGANETFHGGSGFWDIWSGTNYPGGLTHIHGFNALHYTTSSLGSTGGNAYGWQMAAQYDTNNGPWWRRCSAGSFSGWLRLVSYGNNLSGDIYAERFYDHNNTGYYGDFASTSNLNGLTTNSGLTVNSGWTYVANNYGYGIVGLYTSTIFQLVFAMGDSYKTTAGGGISNLYGIAWSHPNAGGIAGNLNSHGALITENGSFLAALSGSVRSRDDMRTPIYYDNNNTGYYLDPNAGTSLRIAGAIVGDHAGWTGEQNKIQWHSGHLYFQNTSDQRFVFRNSNGSEPFQLFQSGYGEAVGSWRAPIFYDSNNTGYYTDPASTSNLNALTLTVGTVGNNATGNRTIQSGGSASGGSSGDIFYIY